MKQLVIASVTIFRVSVSRTDAFLVTVRYYITGRHILVTM